MVNNTNEQLMREILDRLVRIEAKYDSELERRKENDAKLEKHDVRLSALEKAKHWVLGAAFIVGLMGATLKTWIGSFFNTH